MQRSRWAWRGTTHPSRSHSLTSSLSTSVTLRQLRTLQPCAPMLLLLLATSSNSNNNSRSFRLASSSKLGHRPRLGVARQAPWVPHLVQLESAVQRQVVGPLGRHQALTRGKLSRSTTAKCWSIVRPRSASPRSPKSSGSPPSPRRPTACRVSSTRRATRWSTKVPLQRVARTATFRAVSTRKKRAAAQVQIAPTPACTQ